MQEDDEAGRQPHDCERKLWREKSLCMYVTYVCMYINTLVSDGDPPNIRYRILKLKLLNRWYDWFGLPMSVVNFILAFGRIKFSILETSH